MEEGGKSLAVRKINGKFANKLNTKGCCFLCLTVIEFKTEVEESDGDNGTERAAAAKEHCSVSLKILNHYLNINLENLLPSKSSSSDRKKEDPSPSSLKQTEDPKVDLCESCGMILDKFSKLFLSLEKIQMEMDYWQRRIHQQISNASKMPELVQNYSKGMTSDPETLAQLVLVDKLRKEILKMSLEKSKMGPDANVELERVGLNGQKKTQSNSAKIQTSTSAPFHTLAPDTAIDTEEPQSHGLLKFDHQEEYDEEDSLEKTPPNSPSPSSPRVAPYPSSFKSLSHKKIYNGGSRNRMMKTESGIKSVLNSKTMKYDCTKCKKEFKSRLIAHRHYDAIHLPRTWKCDICNISVFSYSSDLSRHKKICRNSLQQRLSAFKATQNDPRYKFACSACGKKFKTHWEMMNHNRLVHLKEKKYACDLCSKTFLISSHLKRHKNAVHLGITFKCGACNKKFKYRAAHKQHERKCEKKAGLVTS